MTKTQTISTVIVLIIVGIVAYLVIKNFKSISDAFGGLGKDVKDFEVSLTDGLNTLDKGLVNTGTGITNWFQGFYNKYLNKPLVPSVVGQTQSDLNKISAGGLVQIQTQTTTQASQAVTLQNLPHLNKSCQQSYQQGKIPRQLI